MNDRAKAGLRGPVSVCRTDVTTFVRACGPEGCSTQPEERAHWTVTRYHADGRVIETRQSGRDGSEWGASYTYDTLGRLWVVESRDALGARSRAVHYYDATGLLQRVDVTGPDGSESTLETFRYDGPRKTKTRHLDSKRIAADSLVLYGVEGTDAAFSAPGATSMITLYDDRGQPIETTFHDPRDRPVVRVALRYDEEGRLVEVSQTAAINNFLPPELRARANPAQVQRLKAILGNVKEGWRRTHRYDREGRCVETTTYWGSMGTERETTTYIERNDPSEKKSLRAFQPFSIDDQGRLIKEQQAGTAETVVSEAQFSYEYDERGNWVERVISSRSQPETPFVVCSIERRSLTYYPD